MRKFSSVILLSWVFSATIVFAAQLTGYAWSSNIGWIKFSGPNYTVSVNDTNQLSGYGWSSNVGWVKFDPLLQSGQPAGQWARACAGASDASSCSGAPLSGAGGWDGWLKLKSGLYGVNRSSDNCRLEGWAWGGDVIGWVHLNGPGYGAQLQTCAPPAVVNIPTAPNCAFAAVPAQITLNGRSTLVWNCQGTADSCSLPALGLNSTNQSGSASTGPLTKSTDYELICRNNIGVNDFFTKVTVLRPTFCEVVPFLGTCK